MAKNQKRVKELKEYRLTRGGEIDKNYFKTLIGNMLISFSRKSSKIHKTLKSYKKAGKPFDEDLRVDIGFYICSLITCWETFFRDMFIFLCNHDQQIKAIFENKYLKEDLQGLTIGEYAAMKYNFQNLDISREAYDTAFDKSTAKFTEHLDEQLFSNLVSTSPLMALEWLANGVYFERIDDTLSKAFEIRHKITHDANYILKFDPVLFGDIEEVFQILPQAFMQEMAGRYEMNRTVFHTRKLYLRLTDKPDSEELPYIFSAGEFIATDWQTVNEERIGV